MAWKQIGAHRYFYLSKRVGDRVVSEYIGRGEAGDLLAQLKQLEREECGERRAEKLAEREAAEREERVVADWFDQIETIATGAMLAAGYHKHRGQWRKRRHVGGEHRDESRPLGVGAKLPLGQNDLGRI